MKRRWLAALLVGLAACHRSDATPLTGVDAGGPIVDAAASLAPAGSARKVDPQLVRETKTVTFNGVAETWSLVWRAAPRPACADAQWSACECQPFAFGETGALDLVRSRPGQPDEVLSLSSSPSAEAKVRKHAPVPEDKGQQPTAAVLDSRPVVEVMHLADYDQDGAATEFAFERPEALSPTAKCGEVRTVVVGVSQAIPKLHVFQYEGTEGGQKAPPTDLVMRPADWTELQTKKRVKSQPKEGCQPGAETHNEWTIAPGPGGLFLRTEKEEYCH